MSDGTFFCLGLILGAMIGLSAIKTNIANQCDQVGTVTINDHVYSCKQTKAVGDE